MLDKLAYGWNRTDKNTALLSYEPTLHTVHNGWIKNRLTLISPWKFIDIFCQIKIFKWFTNLKVLNVEKHNILWSRKEVGNIYGMRKIFAERLVFIQVTV